MKTIFSDALISFGRYKGQTVEFVLGENPGWFLWCRESGVAKLDAELNRVIDEWARLNKKEAEKTRRSALSVRKERMEREGTGASVSADVESRPEPPPVPATAETAVSWGSW